MSSEPIDPHIPAAPKGMTPEDVEKRSDLARHLLPGALPADAETVRRMARENGAPDDILNELSALPKGTYATVSDIWQALGHGVEKSPDGPHES
ncbi:MAG: DUF2795 domain-containing protein [Longispora sp.]|nr:DUF2795 domain-containing protein [Longispora sp. (in: high G+C Gram-positive bacteria)]